MEEMNPSLACGDFDEPPAPSPGPFSWLAREIAAEVERSVQAKLDEHHALLLASASPREKSGDGREAAATMPLPPDGGCHCSLDGEAQECIKDDKHVLFLCPPPDTPHVSKHSSLASFTKKSSVVSKSSSLKSFTKKSSAGSAASSGIIRRTQSSDVRFLKFELSEEFLKRASNQQQAAMPSDAGPSLAQWFALPGEQTDGGAKASKLSSILPCPGSPSKLTEFTSSETSPCSDTPRHSTCVRQPQRTQTGTSMKNIREITTSDLLGAIRPHDQRGADEDGSIQGEDLHLDSAAAAGKYAFPRPTAVADPYVPLVLRFAGLVPWRTPCRMRLCAVAYQWAVLAAALVAALAVWQHVFASQHAGARTGKGLFSDLALAAGAALGLLGLGVHLRSRAFLEVLVTLEKYAQGWNMLKVWHRDMCTHQATSFLAWAFIVAFRVHPEVNAAMAYGLDRTSILRLVAFAFLTGMIMCMCFCMLSVCSALSTMIDLFCLRLLEEESLEDAVLNWNILQAVLRKTSHSIQRCFFMLQGTALTILMLTTADVLVHDHYDFSHIPAILLALVINRIVFSAAAVTGKCCTVPSLISSFCNTIDTERQYVTQHIIHSAAGFYVFGMLLTSDMAAKFMYFAVLGAFTLATKILSES